MGSNLGLSSQFSLTIFIHFTFDFPIDNNGYSWKKALLSCMFRIFLLNVLQWIHENLFDREGRFFWCFPSEGERFNGCLRGFSFIRCKTGVAILWEIYQLHWFCIGDINLSGCGMLNMIPQLGLSVCLTRNQWVKNCSKAEQRHYTESQIKRKKKGKKQ